MPHDELRRLDDCVHRGDPKTTDGRFLLTGASLERFRYTHAAREVVGVGSVRTRAWIVLMLSRDGDDPLILPAKEAGRRCSSRSSAAASPEPWPAGRREASG